MVEGSRVLFSVAISVLRLMEKRLKAEVEENKECTLEETMMILMHYSRQEITRRILLKNLVKGLSRRKLAELRNSFRKKVLMDL
jgi:hypothetical protein